jgi:WD40 repeat protein
MVIKLFLILPLLLLCWKTFSQTEPRLVLPVGHTSALSSAVFSHDGKLALTASGDKTARIYEVSSGKELQVLSGHTSPITSAVFSPDDKLVLSASSDNTARIYEVSRGKVLQVLSGHTDFVRSAVFSPDGKLALTASSDNTARIYEVSTGKELHVLSGHSKYVTSAVFSPDGKLALTASGDSTARIYEVSTGKELQALSGHTDVLNSAVFSPDVKLALTSSYDNTAHIYEVSSGKKLKILSGHTGWVESAVFSRDGKLALTASYDNTARIYEVSTGKELQVLSGHTDWVESAVFSPDGKLALTASSDNTARIYEVSSGKILQVLSGHTDWVESAAFSPDGKLALTASIDITARIYEVSTGKELWVLSGNTKSVSSTVFSPDGKLVFTASEDKTARIYEVSTGKELQVLSGHTSWVRSAVFSPDGKLALTASSDKTARIYEVSSGKELQVLSGHTEWLNSAVFSPDGKLVITSSWDSTACIYEVSSGKVFQVLSGHSDVINSAVFSSDGKLALTASNDNTARIYEVSSGRELQVLRAYKFSVNSALFSPDGKLALTASNYRTARIYEVSSGKELQVLSGHSWSVTSAVFSPDGKLVITASEDTARIYEVSTGKELQVLSGHMDYLSSVVFSPDGKLALTASDDNTARIYEVSSGKELQVLSGHTSIVSSAVFSPDGKKVLTTSKDHKTILWDVGTGKPLYTRLQLKGNDWLVYDEDYHFDGTTGAIDYLYLTCGLEVIDLAQVKDSLWVPGLVEKIMNNEEILINDRPAPKLSDLNICDLTPVIEPLDDGDKGLFRYRIIPRNGGLGETEVYINGNLTYKFKPEQLEKKREQNKDIYYLSISSDTLQGFLTGDKGNENPILVKSKVKGSGIYGRGVVLDIEKQSDKENPKFFGLFIGVNDYGNPNKEQSELRYRNLDFAAKDANDLSKAVEGTARNLFKQDCYIYNLTGTGTAENIPTKANIQKALKEIGEKAKASDILYIFFAGHGDIPESSGEKEIRFILHNAYKGNSIKTYSFGVDELSEWCHPKQIKAQKRVFVFDACHSGQIINQTMAFNGRGDDEATRIRQLDKLKDKNGMMILAAAADNESAYEDETLNQGVLTYHLLDAMKKEKDTSLIIRNWFDEAIEGVKEYSRANGNKQEPNSFGDGRFEIGNVNEQVRAGIDITCPKTRIGMCILSDPTGEAEALYPAFKEKVNAYFTNNSSRGNFVLSKNLDKSYRVEGSYLLIKKKMNIRYKVYFGDKQVGEAISLPVMKKNASEDELVQIVTQSIQSELERLDKRDEKCKRNK